MSGRQIAQSIFTEYPITELFFLGYDYNSNKKKLIDLKSFFPDIDSESELKIRFFGKNDETDISLIQQPFITQFYFRYNQVQTLKQKISDIEFYKDEKAFILSSKYRGFTMKFNKMEENFYAVSYDGDETGEDYYSFLALNEAGREEYFFQHGKYPDDEEEDDDEEPWKMELEFIYSDKNKFLKDSYGDAIKVESRLQLTDKNYYDLINHKDITVRHVVQFATIQFDYKSIQKPDNTTLGKEGRYYVKSLLALKKLVDFSEGKQYLITILEALDEKIEYLDIKRCTTIENHTMYNFYQDTTLLMRFIPLPPVNMNPIDRKLHSHKGIYENGICIYDDGILFAGPQNNENFYSYARAIKENRAIIDDLFLNSHGNK
uniref:CSON015020 protein n=1 Tax=Culicoides sonorensis TaxID=179676 RepID=A0A336KU27_CULSO